MSTVQPKLAPKPAANGPASGPGPGHNSAAPAPNVAADRLRNIIERVERLEEEKKALSSDIKDIYLEAKSAGFNPKVVRLLIKRRGRKPEDLQEEDNLLDIYMHALGM